MLNGDDITGLIILGGNVIPMCKGGIDFADGGLASDTATPDCEIVTNMP